MKKIIILLSLISSTFLNAQNKKQKDIEAIKKMCGCYEIEFNFAETFNYSKDSLYKGSPNKISYALEWVDLTYEDQDKIIIQHILQTGNDTNPHIIKHWRQDWCYEEINILQFINYNHWKNITQNYNTIKGQWTQKVFQVDDSPRYEGSATWIHVDGKSFWENYTYAPVPRREIKIRNDYNVLNRGNRVELTNEGWIHKQDNIKIIRDTIDIILAKEVGLNTYKKVDDIKCLHAQKWWKKNFEKWKIVREEWSKIIKLNKEIKLQSSIENKKLWEYLFSNEYSSKNEIQNIINKFCSQGSSPNPSP